MESSASARVLALVLQRLGDAEFNPVSDRALGRCLGISHTQATRVRKGEYPMDYRAFTRALRYLDLPAAEMMELKVLYEAEVTGDEGTIEWVVQKLREFRSKEFVEKFLSDHPRKIASMLLVALAAGGAADHARASVNAAFSHNSPASVDCRGMYIMLNNYSRETKPVLPWQRSRRHVL